MQDGTIKRCAFITKFLDNSDLFALKLASKELANTVDDDLMKERYKRYQYEYFRYKPVIGETKLAGPSVNWSSPLPITIAHRIPGPGRWWIVALTEPTSRVFKMVKIRITGANTFEYANTKYDSGRYIPVAKVPESGISPETFTVKSCWDGAIPHEYWVELVTKNNCEYCEFVTKQAENTTSQKTWECRKCTFVNSTSSKECEICDDAPLQIEPLSKEPTIKKNDDTEKCKNM